MTRRQFNLRAIKQVREMEQTRARERLEELSNPGVVEGNAETGKFVEDHLLETRRDIRPVSGPLSDRLRQIDPRRFEQRENQETLRVTLQDLDGNDIASLPCDEMAGIIILGRGQNATVKIGNDPYVHRVHAHMRWDASTNSHIIVHGGGENATYVNKRKIRAPFTLHDGHRIRLGRTDLVYRVDS